MRTKKIFQVGLALIPSLAWGQNLVPNGSFEDYIACPDELGDIGQVQGWIPFSGTPDYYNACSDTAVSDVPGNAFGVQPASDGNAYVGCYTFIEDTPYRECVQAQLLAPLVVGQPVIISMALSPGGFGLYEANSVQLGANGIGIRFANQPSGWGLLITDQAAFHISAILLDTSQWVTIGGSYVPDSAYTWIQIGNFFSDASTSTAMMDPDALTPGAYAFIDNVCVSSVEGVCLVPDGSPAEHLSTNNLRARVFGNDLVLSPIGSGTRWRARLFDVSGRECMAEAQVAEADGHLTIGLADLAPGNYTVRLREANGRLLSARFIITQP